MSQMASLVAYATIFLNNILNYLLKGEYVMMMMMMMIMFVFVCF